MNFSLYGFFVGFGFSVFWLLFESTLKPAVSQKKIPFTAGLFLVSLSTLLGARLYHLWTDWPIYSDRGFLDWIAVWNGGLGIYGAVLGGLLGLALWKHFLLPRISWLLLLDAAAVAMPLGQAIGRWGNYVNKELFGLPSSLPWAIEIPILLRPEGYKVFETFHPLFLYESLAMILVGVFFLLLRKRFQELFPLGTGWFFGCYLFAYGSIRFSLELLRIQSAAGWFGLTIAQWVSLLATACGLLLFSRAFRLQWKSEETATTTPTIDSPAGSWMQRTSQRTGGTRAKSE